MNESGKSTLLVGIGMDASGKRPRSDIDADEGYFKRLRVGDPEYLMPLAEGKINQVIVANGDGTTDWKDGGPGELKRVGQFAESFAADTLPIPSAKFTNSIAIGHEATASKTQDVENCVFLGQKAGGLGGINSVAIGNLALQNAGFVNDNNIAIGSQAAPTLTGVGAERNVMIGSVSGIGSVFGGGNVFIGDFTGIVNNPARPGSNSNAIAIGTQATTEPHKCTLGSSNAVDALDVIRAGTKDVCDLGEPDREFKDSYLHRGNFSQAALLKQQATGQAPTATWGSLYHQAADVGLAIESGPRWLPEPGEPPYTFSGRGAPVLASHQISEVWRFYENTEPFGGFTGGILEYTTLPISIPMLVDSFNEPDFGTFQQTGPPPPAPFFAILQYNGPRARKFSLTASFTHLPIYAGPIITMQRTFLFSKLPSGGGAIIDLPQSFQRVFCAASEADTIQQNVTIMAIVELDNGDNVQIRVKNDDAQTTEGLVQDLTWRIVSID
jgi:hypothetical protein